MKSRTFLKCSLIVAGLLCAATLPVAAQGGGGGGGRGGGRGGLGGVLTVEQRGQMTNALASSQAEITQLTEKLTAAQKDAVTAALAANADEKVVRGKLDAVAKIQNDIAMLRFKGVKAIASSVTADQKTQMETNPGAAYNQLFGAGGGFGGGRGARGGGRGGAGAGGGGGGGRRGAGGGGGA